MNVTNTSRKKQTIRTTVKQTFTEGIKTYEDNSDLFLGLLSNKIGEYKSKDEYEFIISFYNCGENLSARVEIFDDAFVAFETHDELFKK